MLLRMLKMIVVYIFSPLNLRLTFGQTQVLCKSKATFNFQNARLSCNSFALKFLRKTHGKINKKKLHVKINVWNSAEKFSLNGLVGGDLLLTYRRYANQRKIRATDRRLD